MDKEESRFSMTKKHHKDTFEEALKQGKMDKDFVSLCKYIASTKNYFTSSCCSGRIVLMELDKKEAKKESAFYRKWHRKVKEKEVLEAVKDFSGEVLWLKQEPLILHLGAKNLAGAKLILLTCAKAGIKRAGIMVIKEGKYIVEILGTQNIYAPVKESGIVASEDYLKYLVKKSNEKFRKNQVLLKGFEKEVRRSLK